MSGPAAHQTSRPRPQVADEQSYEMTGETLGLWRLTAGIGRGGMGEVYAAEYDYEHVVAAHVPPNRRAEVKAELLKLPRAEQGRLVSQIIGFDLPHDARFAIKVCNSRNGTAGYKRFLQEAEVARKLGDHPYIVTVHAVNGGLDDGTTGMYRKLELDRGKHKDVAFMVMDLAVMTIERVRMSIGEAVHVVRCIAQSLDHAHTQNIIHRDLKPENILGSIDHPLLTDFGIAKEIDASEGLTRTGQIIGTLDYMSPEQATDAKHVDPRSDVYSLGVVLYEFATQGGLPYSHKQDRDSCLASIRSERVEPKWPREHMAGFPVGLERIILKAMAHRVDDRYRTMSEFVSDLDRFSRGESIGWLGRIPVKSMLRFQLHRHPRMVWAVAAGMLVPLLALGALSFSRWIDHERRTYEKGLITVGVAVEAISKGQRQQPTKEETEALQALQSLKQEKTYNELRDRLVLFEEALLRHRSLRAVFRPDRSRNETVDGQAAKAALELAANVTSPAWAAEGDGLRIIDASELRLRPYGRGAVCVWVVVTLPASNWQLLRISEDVTYPTRSVSCKIVGDQVQFGLQQDERTPAILRQERVPSLRLSLACELSPTRIRTWIGNAERVHPVSGIGAEAPASVVLTLPAGAVLERLEILPRTWN